MSDMRQGDLEAGTSKREAYKLRLRPEELAEVWALYKEFRQKGWNINKICQEIGERVQRRPATIYSQIKRLTPTTDLAGALLKAKAYEMAERVVKEARTPELIEVLSRPNMGVIAPKQESQSQGGFFLSVQADSCGAVKIGVATGAPQLEAGAEPEEPAIFDTYIVESEPPEQEASSVKVSTQGRIKKAGEFSPEQQAAIARARERLHYKKRRQSWRDDEHAADSPEQGLQGAHGGAES